MLSELGAAAPGARELAPCRAIRDFERQLFESGAATSGELMERAGAAVVAAIWAEWPELAPGDSGAPGSAVVICGPGLNGGDGYVIARLLVQRGWTVRVIGLGDPSALPPEAAAARGRLIDAGGTVEDARDPQSAAPGCRVGAAYDLAVDAVLGSGGRRPIPPGWRATLDSLAEASAHLVCVDGHSALDLDTGWSDCRTPAADLTVTFHRARPGHVLGMGPALSGRVVVADIGLNDEWMRAHGPGSAHPLSLPQLWTRHRHPDRAVLGKSGARHKYDYGHVLVLSGDPPRAGAARLAARAALRTGAGAVTLGVPAGGMASAQAPDALMRRVIDGAADLSDALDDPRVTALCLGPGLGLDRAGALVPAALAHPRARQRELSMLVDADALTFAAGDPDGLFAAARDRRVVITPHAGEFARIFPALAPPRPGNLLDRVTSAARWAGVTVLHKGQVNIVSDRGDTPALVDARDVPWLATAGAGDVLAGIIAGLLARGADPADAAGTGAWLHAAAARGFGPGLIADDLPDQLPAVFRELGL